MCREGLRGVLEFCKECVDGVYKECFRGSERSVLKVS